MTTIILPINDGSDGDGRKWPKHHYIRNDEYFLEKIATEKWIKDLDGGPQPGVIYRLDRLPQGYAGFERARPDSKHIDRYIYGHPRGQFRSLNEFYPHFKHLMDHGTPLGCPCKNCNGIGRATGTTERMAVRTSRATTTAQSNPFNEPGSFEKGVAARSSSNAPFKFHLLPEYQQPRKRKFDDVEGTTDIYESLMKQLKSNGPEGSMDVAIEERASPDWWTGHESTQTTIRAMQKLRHFVPRLGEVVLFTRSVRHERGAAISWDAGSHTFRLVDHSTGAWLEQPTWQAGVVTQLPDEPIADDDLLNDSKKTQSVNYSGFRVEPLSDPGSEDKSWTKQSSFVPLHAIRPFALLRECLNGSAAVDWHPTIQHARKIVSSFCVVGRYRFKGTWPDATVFAMAVYLGPELITVGDTIRLLPRSGEQKTDLVTDIMVVTAIRLRFVNMDLDENDGHLPAIPYQTCLHFSGHVYTVDPDRSYDSVSPIPIDPTGDVLPQGMGGYGTWYHYSKPERNLKIEVPYTRVLGRCMEDMALDTWFASPKNVAPAVSFRPINAAPIESQAETNSNLSRGLKTITDARLFSQKNDQRILSRPGRQWFWADTRIEQLDLHETNDRYVGVRHALRTPETIAEWRIAVKSLTGKNASDAELAHIAAGTSLKAKCGRPRKSASQHGMLASALQSTGEEDEGEDEGEEDVGAMRTSTERDIGDDALLPAHNTVSVITDAPAPAPFASSRTNYDAMDIDDDATTEQESSSSAETQEKVLADTVPASTPAEMKDVIPLDESDSEDDDDAQLGELVKHIRSGDEHRARKEGGSGNYED